MEKSKIFLMIVVTVCIVLNTLSGVLYIISGDTKDAIFKFVLATIWIVVLIFNFLTIKMEKK